MQIPQTKIGLEQFIRNIMIDLQDEYNLAYPTSIRIISELKNRGYRISIKDRKRIVEMREIVKEDVNDWRFI